MNIAITGGAGYIGSHTVRALIEQQHRVIVIDNLSTGFREAVSSDAFFYRCDIRDREALDAVFATEQPEGVIHFAGSSQVGASMTDPLEYYDNNVCASRTLTECMVRGGIEALVFSSSAAVYGEVTHIPIEEEAPLAPKNPYGETKAIIERMLQWTAQAHPLRYVALRYFNACGAWSDGSIGEAHHPETHLIPLAFQVALGQRKELNLFGEDYETKDGSCVRDYIHVCDLAEAHILALKYLLAGRPSLACNLGNGQGYSVKEVVAGARRITGCDIPLVSQARRAGDPAKLVASNAKAKELLGWEPKRPSLNEMIASAWKWHRTHPNGYPMNREETHETKI